MSNNDATQLWEMQKEWRIIVIEKLSKLEEGQEKLNKEISEVKTHVVKHEDYEKLREKVSELEKFKSKLMGIAIAVQTVLSFIFWMVSKLF